MTEESKTGIKVRFFAFIARLRKPKTGVQLRTPKRREGFRWGAIAETIAFLIAARAINHYLFPDDPGFMSVQPHPFWLIAVLIPLRYRLAESLISAILAAALYVAPIVFPKEGIFYFSSLSIFETFKIPILLVFVCGIISDYTDALHKRIDALRGQLDKRMDELKALEGTNEAVNQALKRIESRIAGQMSSVMDLFHTLSRTSRMSPGQIKKDLLAQMVAHANVESCAWFDIAEEEITLVDSIGTPEGADALERVAAVKESILFAEALRTKQVANLGQLARQEEMSRYDGLSLIVGPVLNSAGIVVAAVTVDRISFVNYNPHTFKLVSTMIEWWGTMLEKRLEFEEVRNRSVFNEELGVYNYSYFMLRIVGEFERARRHSIPLAITLIRIGDYSEVPQAKSHDLYASLAKIVTKSVRTLDMVSAYSLPDTICVTFPLTAGSDAEGKVKKIMREIDAFDLHPYQGKDKKLSLSWYTGEFRIETETHRQLLRELEKGLRDESLNFQTLTRLHIV